MSAFSNVYNFANNRGNRRVWIEGKRLLDTGVNRGAEYTQRISADAITLDFAPAPEEKRKRVAGTDARPIIDLCGSYVTVFAAGSEQYRATFDDTGNAPVITITRE